jgi:alpha-D-xyloside xylohydrolase
LSGFFGDAAIVDYSNPEAATWMTEKLDPLFDIGVSCIKTDFGEGAPTDAHYYGVDGEEMHNLYPLLYNRAFYEKTKNRVGEGIVWGRSGYAGSQRYPVQWGGDPAALWEDLANLWHGGLGMGLTGIPFWSMDIGGFGGTPSSKLYIRWLQTGLFVSHPRAHGPIGREPWLFGEEAEALFRAYAELRYRLLAYIWTEAIRAVEHSAPMHQPLLFHAQDDPTAAHIDDQYLFGRDLLVAPMLDPSDHRAIYLTAGRWRDFWSDEPYDGPHWIHREVPLSELPLFVRQDAVIPEIALAQSTDAADFSRVSLHLYPVDGCDRTVELPGEGRLRIEITPTGSGEYRVQLERIASERDRIVDHGPAEQLAVQLHVHETPTTEGTAAPADRARPLPGTSAGTVHLEMGAAAAVDIVSGTEPG